MASLLSTLKQIPTKIASWVITGLSTPGGYLGYPSLTTSPRALLASVYDVLRGREAPTVTPTGQIIRHAEPVAQAAEQVIPTAGTVSSQSQKAVVQTQVPKAEERISVGPQVVTATVPGQVSSTPVATRTEIPATATAKITPTPATPTLVAPTGPSLTTKLTPPTGRKDNRSFIYLFFSFSYKGTLSVPL